MLGDVEYFFIKQVKIRHRDSMQEKCESKNIKSQGNKKNSRVFALFISAIRGQAGVKRKYGDKSQYCGMNAMAVKRQIAKPGLAQENKA